MDLQTPHIGLLSWSILAMLSLILWLIALISILRNDFKDSTTKLVWVLVVLFIPVIGSLLYFTIGRNQRIK